MSDVQFDEDNFSFKKPTNTQTSIGGVQTQNYGAPQVPDNTPRMSRWLMNHGVKSSNAAQIVLIVVVIINIIVTIIMVKFFV
jgi:hypothetical protein